MMRLKKEMTDLSLVNILKDEKDNLTKYESDLLNTVKDSLTKAKNEADVIIKSR
jgi:hypothetical protein